MDEKIKLLKDLGVDYVLLDDTTNIFYLTGIHFSTARLLVSKKKMTLFVDFRYAEKAKKEFSQELIASNQLDEALSNYLTKPCTAAISSNCVALDRFLTWKKKLNNVKLLPCHDLLAPLRMIKSKEEVKKIRQAAAITYAGYKYLLRSLKTGVTEKGLSQKLQIFFLEHGGECAFSPIICFGSHSAIPHHTPTERRYQRGEIVQFDIGCKKESYCSDFSRVHGATGKLKAIEKIVAQAKKASEEVAVPGTTLKELDQAARDVIADAGFGPQFLHSIGHGLGLDIHEAPMVKLTPKMVLEEGMVVTIEPGIYLEGLGGVRLEDTYLITKKGPINLTDHALL